MLKSKNFNIWIRLKNKNKSKTLKNSLTKIKIEKEFIERKTVKTVILMY